MGRYKTYLTILLMFSIYIVPFHHAFAGAAEKWEYEPVQKPLNIEVKAYKVDQYGDAINDKKYEVKIDPKTTANKAKAGAVGMSRLLRRANWALNGYDALQALLEAVDWIIDPQAQSIWRYKQQSDTGSPNQCSGNIFEDGKYFSVKWQGGQNTYGCPLEAAKEQLRIRGTDFKFVKWVGDLEQNKVNWVKEYEFSGPWGNDFASVKATKDQEIKPDKEVLTEEELAEYANHTHPDYSKPELAAKLEPKYKPEVQTNLWKPLNDWEYANSPTVQEVKRQLENASPRTEDDKIKENEPDPETGANSFSLPAFCSWATAVCDVIDWVKKDEPSDNELDIDQNTETEPDSSINFSTACPAKIPLTFQWNGGTLDFSFDFTMWCEAISTFVYPIVVALGSLHALYIVAGVRQDA
ncbi:virulence factor TspB C-terminal domain-related protein [Acinetobacter guerrae]|uniref:virulence factor TspB C-terminal domain-related protein n=1 Tax=Acinetobacter guerrae TaxID=1843371 RepID=UPI00128CE9B6|nr:virulence factor TspB C-terminal domain-related protein [Acinetobacter guerrae]